MINICLTCANNRVNKCAALPFDDDTGDGYFVCDFYVQKRSGAFRRKWAKVSKGIDVTYLGRVIHGKGKES